MASRSDHFYWCTKKINIYNVLHLSFHIIYKCVVHLSTTLVFHYYRIYYLGGLRVLNVQISCSSAVTKTGDDIELARLTGSRRLIGILSRHQSGTKELHALPLVGYPPNSIVPHPFQCTHAFKIDLLACACFSCNSFIPDWWRERIPIKHRLPVSLV